MAFSHLFVVCGFKPVRTSVVGRNASFFKAWLGIIFVRCKMSFLPTLLQREHSEEARVVVPYNGLKFRLWSILVSFFMSKALRNVSLEIVIIYGTALVVSGL